MALLGTACAQIRSGGHSGRTNLRWDERALPVAVGLVAGAGDDRATWLDALEDAAAELNTAARRPLVLLLGEWDSPAPGLIVPVVIDELPERTPGVCELVHRGGRIIKARLRVHRRLPQRFRRPVLVHELAHMLGAGHAGTGALRAQLGPGIAEGLAEEGAAALRALYRE